MNSNAGFAPLVVLIMDGGWGTQVFMDLICAVTMANFLVHQHARARGINPWPWIVSGFVLGSPAPLTYFAVHGNEKPLSN
ncbi:MAG: hypothetical protein AB8H86_09060 [Polyangiales bacterium]